MGLAWVHARARCGVRAPEVRVEVFTAGGLPAITVAGLGGGAGRDARDRLRAALVASQFEMPSQRITINLAPADLPKEGARFDLAMAVGLLAASGQVPIEALCEVELLAELSLGGGLRPVGAVLPAALAAREAGRALVVAAEDAAQAATATGATVYAARTLCQVVAHLRGEARLPPTPAVSPTPTLASGQGPDLADVVGQTQGKRALMVAAAGGHALRFIGPPGCGKTLLARCLPGLLPPLDEHEALEVALIHSLTPASRGLAVWPQARPFRAPLHGASAVALVGGGALPRPGELSLAHHGVLFLDELPEWPRASLEALREPLESGQVHIARAALQAEFPARALLVTAMNPCPCGWAGDPSGRCACPAETIARYQARVSGPLLDRIDLHVNLRRLPAEAMAQANTAEPSTLVREKVRAAWARQQARQGLPNARLDAAGLRQHAAASPAALRLLETAGEALALSGRALHRVLRVARTLADLADSPSVEATVMAEALGFRG
ncbi:YifB family Mg chelatase-like AAA ATPase [Silanimonas sp.]|uniref:YifB family Mg chelatase-like AAA ATPase n=1 Tax=Silanimonas sp. TaxID=1929290 RepID=UPI001BC11D58|nr:YifB family Mg chelatase-like AAA ATPase [Silanimonas sp.]MBS3896848.1 YifB family Mg chelatase-like AAA ATPase [Silanimonas sp.]